ncbi:hypothetical protein FCI23_05365 [Actinacidiphila oryziradicis]|uniref:Uncharacterized protein n=1 Tax=Actinacidiphila oryziradicis TaxID=2571141 RepID=A0A4U0SXE0_9ACTN|nr:hypothetical protein FCI23_05365 [Actinacidiphila oryziradicis]
MRSGWERTSDVPETSGHLMSSGGTIAAWLSAFAAPGQVLAAVYEDAVTRPLATSTFTVLTDPAVLPMLVGLAKARLGGADVPRGPAVRRLGDQALSRLRAVSARRPAPGQDPIAGLGRGGRGWCR